ncbi:MAG: hypothetical protein RML95_15505 [Anaerolineae bacterium]|nr:hypothetical protein [Anaerolineae bacterium]
MNIRAWVSKRVPDNWLALVVIALLFSAPIYLWFNPPNFLGYVNYLPYHSPTQNLLLVFVVPVTLAAQRAIVPQPLRDAHIRFVFIMTSAISVVLMTLSKPSHSIALLPALALVALYRVVRRLPVDWSALVFGFGLPSLLTLALQYLVTYTASQAAAIEVGWLVFFRFYGLQWWDVAARLVLSALFPLTVYCLYFKEAAKDDLLNFSWIIFGISLVWSHFFYESGARLGHGNFTWSASAALFVLMVSSIIFLLRNETFSTFSPRLKAAVAILAFHVISGVAAPSAILLSAFVARLSG